MKRIFTFMMVYGLLRRGLPVLFLLLDCLAVYSQACDSTQCHCRKSDLNPSGIMIGHQHPKGSWMFSYRYMNMRMRDNLSNTNKVSDAAIFQNYIMAPHDMNMDMHMLMAMYGVSSRLSVMAMLNYDVLSMDMNMPPGAMQMQMNGMSMPDRNTTTMRSTASGLSDIKLYAMYTLLDRNNQQLILSGGLNIPTGNIHVMAGSESLLPGERLPYMMQLGSGTYDLLPGITYLLNKNMFTWGTQAKGTYHAGYNTLGYALGNNLALNTWLAANVLPWLSLSARAEACLESKIHGRDPGLYEIMEPDSKADNYGGKRASGYLGLNVYMKRLANSKLSVEYGQPFYRNLNGPQLATSSVLYTGWAVSF